MLASFINVKPSNSTRTFSTILMKQYQPVKQGDDKSTQCLQTLQQRESHGLMIPVRRPTSLNVFGAVNVAATLTGRLATFCSLAV